MFKCIKCLPISKRTCDTRYDSLQQPLTAIYGFSIPTSNSQRATENSSLKCSVFHKKFCLKYEKKMYHYNRDAHVQNILIYVSKDQFIFF